MDGSSKKADTTLNRSGVVLKHFRQCKTALLGWWNCEREVRCRISSTYCYFLCHFAAFAMERFERVFTGGHVRNLEGAVLSRNRIKGVIHYADISEHPRMDITFNAQKNLLIIVRINQVLGLRQLSLV